MPDNSTLLAHPDRFSTQRLIGQSVDCDFGVGFGRAVVGETPPRYAEAGQSPGKGPLPTSRRKSHPFKPPEAVGMGEECRQLDLEHPRLNAHGSAVRIRSANDTDG